MTAEVHRKRVPTIARGEVGADVLEIGSICYFDHVPSGDLDVAAPAAALLRAPKRGVIENNGAGPKSA